MYKNIKKEQKDYNFKNIYFLYRFFFIAIQDVFLMILNLMFLLSKVKNF